MAEKEKVFEENKTCWELKRYGRFLPKSARGKSRVSWRVFDSSESTGKLLFSIVESGHLLVSQDQELLEGFSLSDAPCFLKVLQKSDILLFRMTAKSEGRMFRIQFAGPNKTEALEQCKSAATQLQKYVPVCPQWDAPPTHAKVQKTTEKGHTNPPEVCAGEQAGISTEVVHGSLSLQQLSQWFLRQTKLSLPVSYYHNPLPSGSLGPFLRLCLLDLNFPSFVEQVEAELNRLARD
ncbi:meiotic recombination protein REC114 isoform X1 [Arapaima gigas]